jgi:hypothetical protein
MRNGSTSRSVGGALRNSLARRACIQRETALRDERTLNAKRAGLAISVSYAMTLPGLCNFLTANGLLSCTCAFKNQN